MIDYGADGRIYVYFDAPETGGEGTILALGTPDADALLRFIDLACQNLTLAEATGDSQAEAQQAALRAAMPKLTEAREFIDEAMTWGSDDAVIRGRMRLAANLIDQFMAAIPNREARNARPE